MHPPFPDDAPLHSTPPLGVNDVRSNPRSEDPNTCKLALESMATFPKVNRDEGPAPPWYSSWPLFQSARIRKPVSNVQAGSRLDQENPLGSYWLRRHSGIKSEDAVRKIRPTPLPLSNSNTTPPHTGKKVVKSTKPVYSAHHQRSGHLTSRSSILDKSNSDPNTSDLLSSMRLYHRISGPKPSSQRSSSTVRSVNLATIPKDLTNPPVQIHGALLKIAPPSPMPSESAHDAKLCASSTRATEHIFCLKLGDRPPVSVISKDKNVSDLNAGIYQPSGAYRSESDAALEERRLSPGAEPALHPNLGSHIHTISHPTRVSSHSGSEPYETVPDKSSAADSFSRSTRHGFADADVSCWPKQDRPSGYVLAAPGSHVPLPSDAQPSLDPFFILGNEPDPFFSPEPSIFLSASSEEFSNPSSSSNSASSERQGRLLPQFQAFDSIQEGSLFSSDMELLVENALTEYTLIRGDEANELDDAEAIERRFLALVTAKNALLLRQIAVATDIGSTLELLSPKLRLYTKDKASLATIYTDILSVKKYCFDRQLDTNLSGIEDNPRMTPYDSSLSDRISEMHQQLQPSFSRLADSRAAALRFIKDPFALLENRIGRYSLSQQ